MQPNCDRRPGQNELKIECSKFYHIYFRFLYVSIAWQFSRVSIIDHIVFVAIVTDRQFHSFCININVRLSSWLFYDWRIDTWDHRIPVYSLFTIYFHYLYLVFDRYYRIHILNVSIWAIAISASRSFCVRCHFMHSTYSKRSMNSGSVFFFFSFCILRNVLKNA